MGGSIIKIASRKSRKAMRRQGPRVRAPRRHKYEIEGLGDVWGFTVDRVPMPSESAPAVVKQAREQGTVAAGPSRQPPRRWHKYEIEGLGDVWGFTVDRVPELEVVKQAREEPAVDHDTPARPFASPPFIRSSTDVLRAARAGSRMRPRARCAFVPSACPLGALAGGRVGGKKRKRSDTEVQAAQKEAEAKRAKRAEVRAATRCAAR